MKIVLKTGSLVGKLMSILRRKKKARQLLLTFLHILNLI